jgi:hypothetical protein
MPRPTNRKHKESLMNAKTLSILAGLIAASSAAMADLPDEYTQNRNVPAVAASALSRSDVRAATLEAVRSGTIARNEYERNLYPAAVVPSALQRVQVMAEAVEARKLGLIPEGDRSAPVATPAQAEQIRLAGIAAVNRHVAAK